MLPNSDSLNIAQLNVSIPTPLKDEIKEKADQSNLKLAEFVQKILESFCQDSAALNELPNLHLKRQPKERDLKTSSPSVSKPMNSQLNLDQMLQCLNDRLNRLEGAYVNLMTQIQELQSVKNFYPLLSRLDEQSFFIVQPSAQPSFQHPTAKTQVPVDHSPTEPLKDFDSTNGSSSSTVPKTPQSPSTAKVASKKKVSTQAVSSDLEPFDWLTAREAYQLACQQGYSKKLHNFTDISKSSNANQQYAQWGFVCDPSRKGKPGHPGKWFRCLVDAEK